MESVGKWLWMMTILVIWVQVYGCLEQERAGLLQLKQHLGDQLPSELRSDWLIYTLGSWKEGKTRDCCDDWEGVTCGPNHRVVSLSLDYLADYLVGYTIEVHFNASILIPFAELRELNLTGFNMKTWVENEGSQKSSSGLLKNLELLNLQGNSFNVSSLSQIHGFPSLKYLILDENHLEGFVQLHDIAAVSWNLEVLSLIDSQITGFLSHNGSSKLPSSIKVLDLSDNNKLDNNITSQLSGFGSLHTLNLQNCKLTGIVPINVLHQLRNLKVLDLSHNQITGFTNDDDIEAINQNLEELSLIDNQITIFINHNGSSKLSSSIKVLDLSYNKLDNNIISQLSGFQSLHTLHLRGNQLRENVPLNGSIKMLSSLKVLDLSLNKLGNNIISQISGFQLLHTLMLDVCELTGKVSANTLYQLRNLEVLHLSGNQITGFVANYNNGISEN